MAPGSSVISRAAGISATLSRWLGGLLTMIQRGPGTGRVRKGPEMVEKTTRTRFIAAPPHARRPAGPCRITVDPTSGPRPAGTPVCRCDPGPRARPEPQRSHRSGAGAVIDLLASTGAAGADGRTASAGKRVPDRVSPFRPARRGRAARRPARRAGSICPNRASAFDVRARATTTPVDRLLERSASRKVIPPGLTTAPAGVRVITYPPTNSCSGGYVDDDYFR